MLADGDDHGSATTATAVADRRDHDAPPTTRRIHHQPTVFRPTPTAATTTVTGEPA
jgi:hypothetical protein